MTKVCSKCGKTKGESEFVRDRSTCRECRSAYHRDWYEANRTKHIENVKARSGPTKEKIRAYIRTAKSVPCTDCGVTYPPYVMDFDHLRDKEIRLADAVHRMWSMKKLKTEIEKCEVVCANCHRVRTHNRRNNGR